MENIKLKIENINFNVLVIENPVSKETKVFELLDFESEDIRDFFYLFKVIFCNTNNTFEKWLIISDDIDFDVVVDVAKNTIKIIRTKKYNKIFIDS